MIPVSVGEEYVICIESVAALGSGVGRVNGFTVFVPLTAGGDVVKVRIIRVRRSFAEAELIEVIEPSPDRTEQECPYFPRCGGCRLRHMNYGAQVECKRMMVEDTMKRIGGFKDFVLDKFIPAPNTDHYRNKAVFRASERNGRVIFGFSSAKSRDIIPIGHCLICDADFAEIAAAAADHANKHGIRAYDGRKGTLKSVFVRSSRASGKIAAVISAAGKLPEERGLADALIAASGKISGVMLENNGKLHTVYGSETLTENILGIRFDISPESFLQVNPGQTEQLYKTALDFADIGGNDTVMDLYCGIGTISLAAAKNAGRVIGVEKNERAVRDARRNAELNGIRNAEFFAAGAEDIVPELIKSGATPDVVILDPPRSGSSEKTIDAICSAQPGRIVYVSCDSASLARDVKRIACRGYRISRAAAVDMFPHTSHVETVVRLSKCKRE